MSRPSSFLNLDFSLSIDEIHQISPVKGYIVQASDDYLARSWLILADSMGEIVLNRSFTRQAESRERQFAKIAFSYTHDAFTFCEQSWTPHQIHCNQVDLAGQSKFNFSVTDLGEAVGFLKVLNLVGGGLVLIMGKFATISYDRIEFQNITPDAQRFKLPDIEELECDPNEGLIFTGTDLFESPRLSSNEKENSPKF